MMHILVVGSGGREHALVWKLAASPEVTRITAAPGNPGTALEPKSNNVDIAVDDIDGLINYAKDNNVDLTVVGPEAPLVLGIADQFRAAGLRIFAPVAAAAQLEGSKAFAKAFMQKHKIPTAAHATFTDASEAIAWIKQQGAPIVIKADGLAAGKGVVVAQTVDEASNAVHAMLGERRFGEASAKIVVEEFLAGEEASFIAIVSGTDCLPLATSQDHKARDEGDLGPNTGGMGAYTPAPVVTETVHAHVVKDILQPTIDALSKEGMPFIGFLYVELMIDSTGQARVVEYNVRLGDPETQPLMMRLESDLLPLLNAAVDGNLPAQHANWHDGSAIGIVLAAGNYPEGSSKGETIRGVAAADDSGCKVFHAGTQLLDNELQTAGGRVMCVTAQAHTLSEAKTLADKGAEIVQWKDRRYRRDIGYRAIAREQAVSESS